MFLSLPEEVIILRTSVDPNFELLLFGERLAAFAPAWKDRITALAYDDFCASIVRVDSENRGELLTTLRGDQIVPPSEILLQLFHILNQWMATGRFPEEVRAISNIRLSVHLWVLAAYLKIPVLQNDIINELHGFFLDGSKYEWTALALFCDALSFYGIAEVRTLKLRKLGRWVVAQYSTRDVVKWAHNIKHLRMNLMRRFFLNDKLVHALRQNKIRTVRFFQVDEAVGMWDDDASDDWDAENPGCYDVFEEMDIDQED